MRDVYAAVIEPHKLEKSINKVFFGHKSLEQQPEGYLVRKIEKWKMDIRKTWHKSGNHNPRPIDLHQACHYPSPQYSIFHVSRAILSSCTSSRSFDRRFPRSWIRNPTKPPYLYPETLDHVRFKSLLKDSHILNGSLSFTTVET